MQFRLTKQKHDLKEKKTKTPENYRIYSQSVRDFALNCPAKFFPAKLIRSEARTNGIIQLNTNISRSTFVLKNAFMWHKRNLWTFNFLRFTTSGKLITPLNTMPAFPLPVRK